MVLGMGGFGAGKGEGGGGNSCELLAVQVG